MPITSLTRPQRLKLPKFPASIEHTVSFIMRNQTPEITWDADTGQERGLQVFGTNRQKTTDWDPAPLSPLSVNLSVGGRQAKRLRPRTSLRMRPREAGDPGTLPSCSAQISRRACASAQRGGLPEVKMARMWCPGRSWRFISI